jgi:type II secretory pathway component GspD/PulD (secretin)
LYHAHLSAEKDPLRQVVNLEFREMPLENIVQILKQLGEVKVVTDLPMDGIVSANLKQVPLGRAMEAIFRMQGLGFVKEGDGFRITTREEAVKARWIKSTMVVPPGGATVREIARVLKGLPTGAEGANSIEITADRARKRLTLVGPSELVRKYAKFASELMRGESDRRARVEAEAAESTIPPYKVAIQVKYAKEADLVAAVTVLLSESGTVKFDARSGHLLVTDTPAKVEEIRALVETLDVVEDIEQYEKTQTHNRELEMLEANGKAVREQLSDLEKLEAVVQETRERIKALNRAIEKMSANGDAEAGEQRSEILKDEVRGHEKGLEHWERLIENVKAKLVKTLRSANPVREGGRDSTRVPTSSDSVEDLQHKLAVALEEFRFYKVSERAARTTEALDEAEFLLLSEQTARKIEAIKRNLADLGGTVSETGGVESEPRKGK